MMKQCCCKDMLSALNSDVGVIYIPKFREYGISILDGGSSFLKIVFCPWCGTKLPLSLRDKWFDLLEEEFGIEDTENDHIPKEMRGDTWWRIRGL
ncbi:hypothetical protein [Microbulbifer sp. 2205BS26-8]|uniref:DUF6980 family protein n=1 Tax=Microbulbifer sp. 2205BS26-8 TaxID=3064386 RepID=UPI00273D7E30|nr:hypothetical protein [Microbulbifer sp. 2205BS26-8]MDP5210232.1 hypothetical protein [Microbulbifer sp. 2205BS26-8]